MEILNQTLAVLSAKTLLRTVAEEWSWQNIRNQRPRLPLEDLRGDYKVAMETMSYIQENERLNLLRSYGRFLGISDNRTSKEQGNFYKTLVRFIPARNYMSVDKALYRFNDVFEQGSFEGYSVAAAIYLKSNYDLGKYFPNYASEITDEMVNYLSNPEVGRMLMTREGKLGLVAVTTAHAKFLVPSVGTSLESSPYGSYEEDSGSWLDDFLTEED